MTDPDSSQRRQTADVVLYWMRRRGMTRQVFADRLGTSLGWVDRIRAGDRQLDRLSVRRDIARVPDIPLSTLIDPEEAHQRRQCPDECEVSAVRHALQQYDAITNIFRPEGDVLPDPDLVELEKATRYGWMAFQASDYRAIGVMLPSLTRAAQAAVWQLTGVPRQAALSWLAWTYQLTSATALKLGDAELGWVAADRGRRRRYAISSAKRYTRPAFSAVTAMTTGRPLAAPT
jgi:hypothetical protein